ncbi:ribonuclease J [Paenibacillus soyae]|uniref:Ribonuclease J n=1 Tax=Paenibacillus soyae TaxID=2969249 RepID=A0A9X2S8D0_9BACL|nr:ribonuclease J [Paenibacillus soyae]MCR2804080.1 ribonuclease J [Paenibacillus soyae]
MNQAHSSQAKPMLSVFALGGVYEIGKNMYVAQYGDDIIVIDCGSKFPDESLLGIDLIIPDVSYLKERSEQIRALIITHGHEDHIGAIPYILRQLDIPVYGTPLTLGLIRGKLKEHGISDKNLHTIQPDSEITLGKLPVAFFRTNHSIPDCVGISIRTPEGTVVHTGDFKFDLSPANGQFPDLHKMARIGEQGVLLLLSESTNAERPGFTPSERMVGERIEEAFQRARNAIFLTTFASNVNRVQQVVDAAMLTNRRLLLLGRSMVNVVKVASDLGYLNIPEGMIVEPKEAANLPRERLAVLCTGSQGEPLAALSRLATSTHPLISIEPGDTVIFASSPIPGNEKNVSATLDHLYLLGANVIHGGGSATGMHVSGHGSQEELKLMLALMKPRFFVPIHGEYRMLHHHRQLAESVGVDRENIFIMKNGEILDIQDQQAVRTRQVPAGNMLVDGFGIGDVGNIVLRDRRHLSEDGILIVVITLSSQDSELLSDPDVITRGFVYVRESEGLLNEVSRLVIFAVEELQRSDQDWNWSMLKTKVKDSIGGFLYAKTKRRPMILPIIIEV